MAIYMGEKLAMVTNQVIPHHLARQVSDFLSYRRGIPTERIALCKKALKFIGKIDRELIYDPKYDYHHILIRKAFNRYATETNHKLESAAVQHMLKYTPEIWLQQTEPFHFIE